MTQQHWVRGDDSGLDIPATAQALREGGVAFLDRAFRASGALPADNRVAAITQAEDCFGGGTGSKLLLAVQYEKPQADLPEQLFVKFSRNFDDPLRDRSRHMMRSEIRFAALTRTPGFPIRVAQCLFADFNAETGSGLLITERVTYGAQGNEPHYLKCLDYELPQPLEHYRAIMRALARLSGTHKAGQLHPSFYQRFPYDLEKSIASEQMRYDADQVMRRVGRTCEFLARYPQLFPENLRDPAFAGRFAADVPGFYAREQDIRRLYFSEDDFIALCHWNGNIDNAWFWSGADGQLECGLLDWGQVGQMSVAQSIYGAFSGAEPELWDAHLDDIVATFADEFARCGGPQLDTEKLRDHMLLVTGWMGVAFLLDYPTLLERRVPDLADVPDYRDPRIRDDEDARVPLHMLTMFLNQWQRRDIGALARRLLDTPQ
ncbi:hypothetical protein E4634_09300 [Mangrovimicrobium sediminis]|uniref:Aminoglycoside phosphotransferase domain-containing protein n=1 Tax=Mangrovimicrobium sediminis TaxID=2562682 RepID=A0A4Z0M4C2_9GAMM|nr:hypothetical protein [Haliea sp. SAOS-164]TGD74304.1 hypothetical protein E4634_09300 [Haliea sp. SAOS-164]